MIGRPTVAVPALVADQGGLLRMADGDHDGASRLADRSAGDDAAV